MLTNKDLPAHPQPITTKPDHGIYDTHGHDSDLSGLTKREIFAMAAMQGFLANQYTGKQWDALTIARQSIIQADALLAELEKPTP